MAMRRTLRTCINLFFKGFVIFKILYTRNIRLQLLHIIFYSMLSRRLYATNFFRAISRVMVQLLSNMSETVCLRHQNLIIEAETVSETLNINSIFTRLIAQEYFTVLTLNTLNPPLYIKVG
jgi:hypothetical protein